VIGDNRLAPKKSLRLGKGKTQYADLEAEELL
jgi:hypothetical protein